MTTNNRQMLIATRNPDKLREMSRILLPLGIEAKSERELGLVLPEVEETGATFEQNAYLKASSACRVSGMAAVADDSGLCVDALAGAPGIYSARYAPVGHRKERVLREMHNVPRGERSARFVCAVCCAFPSGAVITARGECEGEIAFCPIGNGGFGYDPIFLVGEKTFAQLTSTEKDAVSHRGRALRDFSGKLEDYMREHSL